LSARDVEKKGGRIKACRKRERGDSRERSKEGEHGVVRRGGIRERPEKKRGIGGGGP